MALHSIDLCDGFGGFDLSFRHAGLPVRTVCRVERDSHAAAVLVARMEEQTLDLAPVWDNIESFDGLPWRGRVDLITAGFPCQPFSELGHQRGLDDDRWLWPDVARVVGEVGPSLVFLENVPGILPMGGASVLWDLTSLGFDQEWIVLGANAAGAPHERERWWCLAWRKGLADSTGVEQQRLRQAISGQQGGLLQIPEHGGFPPLPDDESGWKDWVDRGGCQPSVRRVFDGVAAGVADALRLGGNGIVPQCAALAFRILAERAQLGWLLQ